MRGVGTKFETALYAYLDGEMTLKQALALAEENKTAAQMEIDTAFMNVATTGTPTLDSPAGRLLQLAWMFFGPHRCLQFTFVPKRWGSHASAVELFLQRQLAEDTDQFSDGDLELIKRYWPVLSCEVRQIQTVRLSAHAEHLLEQPRQLTDDLDQVKKYVSAYDFARELNELLDKVEHGLASSGDSFDQAALLKHLRTFFEQLHKQAGERLRQNKPATVDGTDLSKCGQAIDYLQRKGVLTEGMRQLARALYGVLSNEGVHAVRSEREYVRLCRNMAAEYGLILFYELDRRLQQP